MNFFVKPVEIDADLVTLLPDAVLEKFEQVIHITVSEVFEDRLRLVRIDRLADILLSLKFLGPAHLPECDTKV